MPKVEMNMPDLPEGWEYTGEYEVPAGMHWATDTGGIADGNCHTFVPIVRRVQKWRPAKIEDIDKGLKCRVSVDGITWCDGVLSGWNRNAMNGPWIRDKAMMHGWKYCEVLDS